MFENDDWTFEDRFNDFDEKTIQSHSRCQSEEKTSSVKRRKIGSCRAISSLIADTFNLESNTITNAEDNNPPYSDKISNVSRGNLLLGIFQKNTKIIPNFVKKNKNSTSIGRDTQCFQSSKTSTTLNIIDCEEFKEKNHIKSIDKIEFDTEVKLVRVFPGPAGLMTNMRKDDISIVSYLNYMKKELENETVKHIEINLSESQDGKNFGETAWKLLLNDLPNNFLKEHGISVIKNKANTSHCNSMKVKFIAGILEYIDYSQDDPYIILKDSTGSIEGTIHRDILLNYPGILEPNVVILLYNVGLLKTTTHIITNKYHILVSQVNLLAIYSDKGQIVSTSRMKNILSNISNVELNRDYCMPISKHCIVPKLSRMHENTPLQTNLSINTSCNDCEPTSVTAPLLHQSSEKNESCKQFCKNDLKNRKITDEISECFEHSIDIDCSNMNDIFFKTDCGFVTSEKENRLNCLSHKTILQTSKIQQYELQTRNTNYLEGTRKNSVLNFQDNIKKQNLLKTLQKCVTDINTTDTYHSRKSLISYDSVTHKVHKDSSSNNSKIKSTMPMIKQNIQNSNILVNYFTNDNEYDSDDESLSQLDVDNVFHNHQKEI